MSYCNGTSNEWVLCNQSSHPATLQRGSPCWCPVDPADRTMTLSEATAIVATASLPSATGLTIAWAVGFYPTTPVAVSSLPVPTLSSQSGTVSATAIGSSTSPPAAETSPPDDEATSPQQPHFPTAFSTGAKVGTVIGAAVVGLLLLGLVGFFVLRCRRAKQAQQARHNGGGGLKAPDLGPPGRPSNNIGIAYGTYSDRYGGGGGGDGGDGAHDVSALSMFGPSPHMSMVSEMDNKAARPWSGMSELDGGGGRRGSFAGPAGGQMEAIAEASHGFGVGYGGPAELEAPRGPVELPA